MRWFSMHASVQFGVQRKHLLTRQVQRGIGHTQMKFAVVTKCELYVIVLC